MKITNTGKRTRSGRRIFKVRYKKGQKPRKSSIKKMISTAIQKNNEYSVFYQNNGYIYVKYNVTSPGTTTLKASHWSQMQAWPAQALTQAGRSGNVIKNVNANWRIQLKFYNWVNKTTPTGSDVIHWMLVRIIVFTSDVPAAPNTPIVDFWKIADDATELENNRVNRSKFTVLYDKVHQFKNQIWKYSESPPPKAVDTVPTGGCKFIKIRRRWNQITFPKDGSNEPQDYKKITYLAVIPITEHVTTGAEDWICETNTLMTMYYTR